MKKVFKFSLKVVLVIAGVALMSFSIFRASEHLKGNSYISYLESHKETVELQESFSFDMMEEDLSKYPLILVGDIHGFKALIDFNVEFFTHLHHNYDVNTYILEMDYSQAYFMNKYNRGGSDSLLKRTLRNWAVVPGQDTENYFQQWKALKQLHQNGKGFTYIGTDQIFDVELLAAHINELEEKEAVKYEASLSDSTNLEAAKAFLESRLENMQEADSLQHRQWEYGHLLTNINAKLENPGYRYRETNMTNNLLAVYEHFGLYNEKVYSFYGLGHTMLKPLEDGYKAMATRISEKDPWFENNTMVVNPTVCDSYMTLRNKALPGFLRSEGKYKKTPASHDNIWLNYLYGIEDLKRVTTPFTKTIFKLDGGNSPYLESTRMLRMFHILPVGNLMNAKEDAATADYMQYVIFIRNSDWSKPFEN